MASAGTQAIPLTYLTYGAIYKYIWQGTNHKRCIERLVILRAQTHLRRLHIKEDEDGLTTSTKQISKHIG